MRSHATSRLTYSLGKSIWLFQQIPDLVSPSVSSPQRAGARGQGLGPQVGLQRKKDGMGEIARRGSMMKEG